MTEIRADTIYDAVRAVENAGPPPPFKVLLNPWLMRKWIELGFPPEGAQLDPPLPR